MAKQVRTNTHMALIVEQGVKRDHLHGSVVAWKFLASQQVPDAVILRVLSEPDRRRSTDAPAAIGAPSPIESGEAVMPMYSRPE